MSGALSDIRVIDLSSDLAGAWAARLFGDQGADVILAEPPEGHCLRHEPPFATTSDGSKESALHAYANWNKRSVIIEDGVQLTSLVSNADVLITNQLAPFSGKTKIAIDALPTTGIHLSITPHGLTGPWASYPGNNLTLTSRVGWAAMNRRVDEPPLQLPLRQTGYIAGVAGFVSGVAAVIRRHQTGEGETVDLSQLEALSLTCYPWALMGNYIGGDRVRYGVTGARTKGKPGPLWQTSDGYINFGFGEWKRWTEALSYLGLDDFANDEVLIPVLGRQQKDLRPISTGLADSVISRNKWDIFNKLAELHCISGVVQNAHELLHCEQMKARSFYIQTNIGGQSRSTAGAPAKLSETPYQHYRSAPDIGEHNTDCDRIAQAVASRNGDKGAQPLAGIRVLTFTQAWSGTFATELLALLGADVVQIEARKRPDVWRGAGSPVPPAIRDENKEQSPLNTNGMYNSVNLNKRAITLDMGSEEGLAMFWEMLPHFDVVAENFSPHVMSKWGITLDTLREKKPDIIFASLSGYGRQGPWSEYPANGATTEPMSGFASVHGYEDDEAANTAGLIPDPITGYYFASSILSAIHHRNKTGQGQRIDEAMMEAVAVQMGDGMLHCDATGEVPRPRGNRHPRHAPHNVFQDSDGEWLAIAVDSDDAWLRLCETLNMDNEQSDDQLRSSEGRKAAESRIDDRLSALVAQSTASELEARLCRAGVAAAAVQPFEPVYADPSDHVLERGFMVQLTHVECGQHYYATAPWIMQGLGRPSVRVSPCFGAHSQEVFAEELGLSAADYERLEAEGITGKSRL